MTYARRRDENHSDIKQAFEALDMSVLDVASYPIGFDLIVGYKTQCILVEVKDGEKSESRRQLTENEQRIHLNWKGPKAIVKSIPEAIAVAQLLRRRHFDVMMDVGL